MPGTTSSLSTTLLRIDSRIPKAPREKLEKELKSFIKGDIEIVEYVHGDLDPQKHIYDRAQSLNRTFNFMLDALPSEELEQKPELKALIIKSLNARCEEILELEKPGTKELAEEYERFLLFTCRLIKLYWPAACKECEKQESLIKRIASKIKETAEDQKYKSAKLLLGCAERYQILVEESPSIATLSQMAGPDNNGVKYFLQYDRRLPSYSPEWLAELEALKKNIKEHGQLTTPDEFNRLSNPLKVFFHGFAHKKNWEESDDIETKLKEEISNFETGFKNLTVAELTQLNNDLKEGKAPKISWFNKLHPYQQQFIREFNSADNLEKGFKELVTWQQQEDFNVNAIFEGVHCLKLLPLWYACLPSIDQRLFSYLLSRAESLEELIDVLSSRLRNLPGIANFRETSVHIALKKPSENNENQENNKADQFYFKELTSTFAGAHLASRDIKGAPKVIQNLYTKRNLLHFINIAKERKEQNTGEFLVLTKVSPLVGVPDATPDAFLDDELKKVVSEINDNDKEGKSRIILYNTPLNAWKHVDWMNAKSAKDLLIELKSTKNDVQAASSSSSSSSRLSRLEELADEMIEQYDSWPYSNEARELMLGSLAVLLAREKNIIVYGSCVSGKDREFLHSILTGAIAISKELKKGTSYRDIVAAHLYSTGHGKALAEQNGPGAWGTKHPFKYLPENISDAIKGIQGEDSLRWDNYMATTIDPEHTSLKTPLTYEWVAEKIGSEECKKLKDIMIALLGQEGLFKHKTESGWWSSPGSTGIKALKAYVDNSDNKEKSPIIQCADMFEIICSRPAIDKKRPEMVEKFYAPIRELCDHFPELSGEVIKKYNMMFQNSLNKSPKKGSHSDSELAASSSEYTQFFSRSR